MPSQHFKSTSVDHENVMSMQWYIIRDRKKKYELARNVICSTVFKHLLQQCLRALYGHEFCFQCRISRVKILNWLLYLSNKFNFYILTIGFAQVFQISPIIPPTVPVGKSAYPLGPKALIKLEGKNWFQPAIFRKNSSFEA